MEKYSFGGVRVRFAPSPTGDLHIGGLRTALFNYLFTLKNSGRFILRIDDTDKIRSKKAFEESIINDLNWTGIKWDEFYRQSERTAVYEHYLSLLKEKGLVYECYCTEEEIIKSKELAIKSKKPFIYNGKCLHLSPREADDYRLKFKEKGLYPSIRLNILKTGLNSVEFNDMVHGRIAFNPKLIGDFILKTEDDRFTYNFASIIDDSDLGITHVIRGEDHISNTPKQILLLRALEKDIPVFAHISLLYGKDGKIMSKRDSAANTLYYKNEGYLPGAILNYLAITGNTFAVSGKPAKNDKTDNREKTDNADDISNADNNKNICNPDNNCKIGNIDKVTVNTGKKTSEKEVFSSISEMASFFDITRTKGSSAVFSEEKLKFINEKWLLNTPASELLDIIENKFPLLNIIHFKPAQDETLDVSAKNTAAPAGKTLAGNVGETGSLTAKLREYYPSETAIEIIDFLKREFKTVKEILSELKIFFDDFEINQNDINNSEITTGRDNNEYGFEDFKNLKAGLLENLKKTEEFNEVSIKNAIKETADGSNKTVKDCYEALRLSLTGKLGGASIIKIAALLGKHRVIVRLA